MSEDRKYKQRGYQEYDQGSRGRAPGGTGMPRMPVITTYKETVRCDNCGNDLSTLFEVKEGTRCPKCDAPLHSCRNCYSFDPSAHFECAEDVKKRISKKSADNKCPLFQVRAVRVKDLGSTPAAAPATRTEDARKALEDLFKK